MPHVVFSLQVQWILKVSLQTHCLALLATDAGLDAFAVPIIMGSVAQLGDLEFESATRHLTASLTLLARRSLRRAGTRHWRRGADLQVSSPACHAGALQGYLLPASSCAAVKQGWLDWEHSLHLGGH